MKPRVKLQESYSIIQKTDGYWLGTKSGIEFPIGVFHVQKIAFPIVISEKGKRIYPPSFNKEQEQRLYIAIKTCQVKFYP
jgi:hypothetical protein